jgi:PrcB C-terminal
VPFTDISARFPGFAPARLVSVAFKTPTKFADFLQDTMPGSAPPVPTIDWPRREAILIATGPRSSTGYSLRVVSVQQRGARLVVTVNERTPALGDPVVARVTYPYRLITVPRIDKKLLLHIEGRP